MAKPSIKKALPKPKKYPDGPGGTPPTVYPDGPGGVPPSPTKLPAKKARPKKPLKRK